MAGRPADKIAGRSFNRHVREQNVGDERRAIPGLCEGKVGVFELTRDSQRPNAVELSRRQRDDDRQRWANLNHRTN